MAKKALVLSGGGSKGAFTAGVVERLLKNPTEPQEFNMAVGTSTGALVGGPALLKDTKYLAAVYTNVRNGDVFKNTWIGGLVGSPIAADMKPLHEMLKKYYLEGWEFEDGSRIEPAIDRLLASGKFCAVAIVQVKTGLVHIVSSHDVADGKIKKETFVRAILASASEPVFTQPVRVFEEEAHDSAFGGLRTDSFYDGGVKEFLPLEWALTQGAKEIWAVSTHPLKYKEAPWGSTKPPDKVSILKVAGWTLSSFLDEVARGDKYRAEIHYKIADGMDLMKAEMTAKGMSAVDADAIIAGALEVITDGRRLEDFYMIRPDHHLPTSLEFDPAIMEDYYLDGRIKAKEFLAKSPAERSFKDITLQPWSNQAPGA